MIELNRELADVPMLGMNLFIQGGTAITLRKYDSARALLEESLAIAHEAGDSFRIAHTRNSLGDLARCEGHFAQAHACYEESLSLLGELGAARDVPVTLHNLAHVYLQQGNIERAHVPVSRKFASPARAEQWGRHRPGSAGLCCPCRCDWSNG